MNFFDHKDLGNHLLQLCPKVVKHPVFPIGGGLLLIPIIYKCLLKVLYPVRRPITTLDYVVSSINSDCHKVEYRYRRKSATEEASAL